MKKDIILSGVGGQGILSIATVIGVAAISKGLYIKQAEVHGMSQRGGDVQSNLRLSDKPISSDLIPEGKADLILSVEPMESLRYLPFLHKEGWIISNSKPFVNIPNYPDLDTVNGKITSIKNHVLIEAEKIASDIGNKRMANMVILGAASPYLDIEYELLEKAIHTIFHKKGEKIVEQNHQALKAGRDIALQQ